MEQHASIASYVWFLTKPGFESWLGAFEWFMRKILFFTSPIWAFGSIHNALIKRLRPYGIHADLLDWSVNYTPEAFAHFQRIYDYFLVSPDSLHILHRPDQYCVPLDRIISVAHHMEDFAIAAERMGGLGCFDELAAFGAVHQHLADRAAALGIRRSVPVVINGVETDMFHNAPAAELRNVGHVGGHKLHRVNGEDCKRPELADRVFQDLPLTLKSSNASHYLAMPARYWEVDATLVTSSYESCGMPYLESAAAGRLVVGTPTGYFEQHHAGLGAVCRMDPEQFVQDARATLLYYRDSPIQYRQRCQEGQDYCRQHFDWSWTIDTWLEIFS